MQKMHKLKHAPLQSGFSVSLGCDVIQQDLDGGLPRARRKMRGSPHMVNVSWKLKHAEYQYIMAFYRVWQQTPSRPFIVEMPIDNAEVKQHKAVFSANSFKVEEKNGDLYSITAKLIVHQIQPNQVFDDFLVDVHNDIDDVELYLQKIEEFTNNAIPQAMQNE